MKTIRQLLTVGALLCLALQLPLRADGVTGSSGGSLASGATLTAVKPLVATMDRGINLAVWLEHTFTGRFLYWKIMGPTGTVVQGPVAIPLGNLVPDHVAVAASPYTFGIAVSGSGGSDGSGSGVYLAIIDENGYAMFPGLLQVNVQTSIDETTPGICGLPGGGFAVAFSRRLPNYGASQGIFVRRFDAVGIPVDSLESRVDDPAANTGHQQGVDIAAWPDGDLVVVWEDGGPGISPDGSGRAIVGRFLEASLVPKGSTNRVINATGANDQVGPRVDTNHRAGCAIAWTGSDAGGLQDVWFRRFDADGTPQDPADVPVTSSFQTSQILSDLCMGPSGEFTIAWSDLGAYLTGPGTVAASFARFTQLGIAIETLSIISFGSTEGFPAVSCDTWGNLFLAWMRTSYPLVGGGGPSISAHWRLYRRQMIVPTTTTPIAGQQVPLVLDSPSDPQRFFQLAVSITPGLIPLDSRWVQLGVDNILVATLQSDQPPWFTGLSGYLDTAGRSTQPQLTIPAMTQLIGLQLHLAFVTIDAAAPSMVNTISHTTTLTIQ